VREGERTKDGGGGAGRRRTHTQTGFRGMSKKGEEGKEEVKRGKRMDKEKTS